MIACNATASPKTVTAAAFARRPRLTYTVGGISAGIFAPSGMKLQLDREMELFASNPGSLDIRIDVDWVDDLRRPSVAPLFDSGGLWSLFEESGGYRFYFCTPFLGSAPYKAAWFDRDFSHGHIALFRRYYDPQRAINPIEYPLDELLAIHRLSRGEGVEVHAVGVVDAEDRGHLFLGHSGAGKSTSARLWQQSGGRVLSDDRIILRLDGERVCMFGTPWHGDAGIALSDSAELSSIYILAHGLKNDLTLLSPGRAAAELFARSFVPHHSAEGVRCILNFLDRITSQIPCSVFEFLPDFSSVEAIYHA